MYNLFSNFYFEKWSDENRFDFYKKHAEELCFPTENDDQLQSDKLSFANIENAMKNFVDSTGLIPSFPCPLDYQLMQYLRNSPNHYKFSNSIPPSNPIFLPLIEFENQASCVFEDLMELMAFYFAYKLSRYQGGQGGNRKPDYETLLGVASIDTKRNLFKKVAPYPFFFAKTEEKEGGKSLAVDSPLDIPFVFGLIQSSSLRKNLPYIVSIENQISNNQPLQGLKDTHSYFKMFDKVPDKDIGEELLTGLKNYRNNDSEGHLGKIFFDAEFYANLNYYMLERILNINYFTHCIYYFDFYLRIIINDFYPVFQELSVLPLQRTRIKILEIISKFVTDIDFDASDIVFKSASLYCQKLEYITIPLFLCKAELLFGKCFAKDDFSAKFFRECIEKLQLNKDNEPPPSKYYKSIYEVRISNDTLHFFVDAFYKKMADYSSQNQFEPEQVKVFYDKLKKEKSRAIINCYCPGCNVVKTSEPLPIWHKGQG